MSPEGKLVPLTTAVSANFRYPAFRIVEIVKAQKVIREGQSLSFKRQDERGRSLMMDLDLVGGEVTDLRFFVAAGRYDEPTTYRAALILSGERIRGIDYSFIRKLRFYKEQIPQGWHENLIDPNLTTRDMNRNRHEPMHDFEVSDLGNFLHQAAQRRNIQMPSKEDLL